MNQILKHRNPLKYDGKDQLMVVIEFEERLIGIKVDEVMGNHNVVIKPLQGQMEDATHVSGFTILGTGNVSLILDVRSIFQRFQGTSV
jgi:two-component system chemotaxis sensor kinase CheA